MKSLTRFQRDIILQYRFADGLSFPAISNKMKGVTTDAVRQFCYRTRQRAGSDRMVDLLANSAPLRRSGRPRRVEPGSEASIRIRESVRGRGKYQSQEEAANAAFKRVRKGRTTTTRKPLGELDSKQVYNITQGSIHSKADTIDSRPISRLRALEKVPFHKLNLPQRKEYCEWILSLDPAKTILIGCDETPLDFGGSGHTHISAPRGSMVFADQASDPRFKKMQWDAASNDVRVTRPCVIWNREEEEDTEILRQKLAKEVALLKQKVHEKRTNAKRPGTWEFKHLRDINTQITTHNATIPKGQRFGKQHRMTAERLFKFDKLERNHQKGGLDFVWYAFKIYEEQLFPYYVQLQQLNPGKDVYILEDNVGVHLKARRLMADQIAHFGIKFQPIPVNSPDLYPIEKLHKDQKIEIDTYRQGITSAAASVQADAEREMRRIWQQSPTFAAIVKQKFAITYWQGLARRCSEADPKWSNRYKDSI